MDQLNYAPEADAIRGTFAFDETTIPAVAVECDGSHWATVPAFAVPDRRGVFEFSCALAPVATATSSTVVVRTLAGDFVGRRDVLREPLRNGAGLLASAVYETNHHPLFALPWITFDGARLTIGGMHLPPEGDPGKLQIAFGPGVRYEKAYATRSEQFRAHYWYWPNADLSTLSITIDVAASARDSDPFHFRFLYPSPSGAGGGKRPVDLWLPPGFRSFRGYPTDSTQLTRVQTWSTPASVTMTGYNAFKSLEALFVRAGVDPESGPAILDWGCGHGRVTCHFIDEWPNARIYGADIDADNIGWCRDHLDRERFSVVPLWPPSRFADAEFDGVFGISVMTHLTAEAQRAWLAELARILKPGATALLTFAAEANAAYQSIWRDAAWWARWQERGFDDEQLDPALEGHIEDPTYYRNTMQTTEHFMRECGGRFDVVSIEPAIFGGYQDCAILRRR